MDQLQPVRRWERPQSKRPKGRWGGHTKLAGVGVRMTDDMTEDFERWRWHAEDTLERSEVIRRAIHWVLSRRPLPQLPQSEVAQGRPAALYHEVREPTRLIKVYLSPELMRSLEQACYHYHTNRAELVRRILLYAMSFTTMPAEIARVAT